MAPGEFGAAAGRARDTRLRRERVRAANSLEQHRVWLERLGLEAAQSILAQSGIPHAPHPVYRETVTGVHRVVNWFWSTLDHLVDRPLPRLFLLQDGTLAHRSDYECSRSGVWGAKGPPLMPYSENIPLGPVIVLDDKGEVPHRVDVAVVDDLGWREAWRQRARSEDPVVLVPMDTGLPQYGGLPLVDLLEELVRLSIERHRPDLWPPDDDA